MNKKGGLPVPGEAHSCTIQCFLGPGWAVFRMGMNKEGGSPILGEAPLGRGGAVFRLEMTKKVACPFLERPHSCTI